MSGNPNENRSTRHRTDTSVSREHSDDETTERRQQDSDAESESGPEEATVKDSATTAYSSKDDRRPRFP